MYKHTIMRGTKNFAKINKNNSNVRYLGTTASLARLAIDHAHQHAVALDELMVERGRNMNHDQRQQHIGQLDVTVLQRVGELAIFAGELRHPEQAEEACIVRLMRAGMGPAEQRDHQREKIERAMI